MIRIGTPNKSLNKRQPFARRWYYDCIVPILTMLQCSPDFLLRF